MQEQQPSSAPELNKILIACQQLEMTCASIYREMAEKCGSDSRSRLFFLDLARDEERHCAAYDLLFKLMEHTEISSGADLYKVSAAVRAMEAALGHIRQTDVLPLKEMLRVAIKSEERLIEFHSEYVAVIPHPEWKQFFGRLHHEDNMHLQKIRTFQASIGG